MSKELDKLFKQIQKNSEQMAMDAMMKAANDAYLLSQKKAVSCLKNYLKKKPKIYKRINPSPLTKAIMLFKPRLHEKNGTCTVTFGIGYDSEKIKGMYKSNSWYHQGGGDWISRYDEPEKFNFKSQHNGIPDSGWILSNYLQGIHPGWVNGEDHGWVDSTNTASEMQNFFEKELREKAGALIYETMQDAVINFIKTNGGGK